MFHLTGDMEIMSIEVLQLTYLVEDKTPCKCGHAKGEHKIYGATYLYTEEKNGKTIINACFEFEQDNLRYLEMKAQEKEK